MTLTTADITSIDWLGMRLRVPSEWTIVRHNVSSQKGRLTLVDRRRQRLMLAWSPCADVPDWDRMLQDQQTLESQEHPDAAFSREADRSGWHVLERQSEAGMLLRTVRYDRQRHRVIEMVMPVHSDQDEADASLVLDEFEALPVDDNEANRFRAFDVDIAPPMGWTLASVEASLGRVQVRFEQGRCELTVRRMGLADTWFHGDTERFLRKELKDPSLRCASVFQAGHPASRADGRETGPRIKSLAGMLRRRIDVAWFEPRANAVMHVTLLHPRGINLDLSAFNIICLDACPTHE